MCSTHLDSAAASGSEQGTSRSRAVSRGTWTGVSCCMPSAEAVRPTMMPAAAFLTCAGAGCTGACAIHWAAAAQGCVTRRRGAVVC